MEQGCSNDHQAEEQLILLAEEEEIDIPRKPPSISCQSVDDVSGNFRIGSYNLQENTTPQAFDYVVDADNDDGYIERGMYHAQRTVAYFEVSLPTMISMFVSDKIEVLLT